MAARRILITGASGFVGRALCNVLLQNGFDVLAAVRCVQSSRELHCSSIAVGNIDAQTDWRSALSGIDAIVHLAARVHFIRDEMADSRVYRA
jgi:nucleoside-diphosphate-sugar epimerase